MRETHSIVEPRSDFGVQEHAQGGYSKQPARGCDVANAASMADAQAQRTLVEKDCGCAI